jgi:hypothetical protein
VDWPDDAADIGGQQSVGLLAIAVQGAGIASIR